MAKGWEQRGLFRSKKNGQSAVYHAKKFIEREKMHNLEKEEGNHYIFKLAKKIKHENQDVISERCIKNDEIKHITAEEDRLKAWKDHYNHLLNIEFPWESEPLAE